MTARRQAGFTLMEVLVALLIFGILMTGLMQGTQFGIQAWTAQSHAVAAQQDLDLVDHTIRRLVGTIDPQSQLGAEKFVGNQHSMAFTAAMPEALTAFHTRQADVVVSVSPAHVLELRWAPHYKTLIGPQPQPHVSVLLAGVDHIELSYYTAQNRWVSDWQVSDGLPGLVRLRVVFLHDDTREWPPIVASVNTT